MAKRDILLRLTKAQAQEIAATIRDRLDGRFAYSENEQILRIASMKLTKVIARHEEKTHANALHLKTGVMHAVREVGK